MPIDPYAALNAMLRAEAARFAPPVRQPEPAATAKIPDASAEDDGEPQHGAAAAQPVRARSAAARTSADSAA
ncbi:hypothetical protein ACN6AT_18150 [Streptomyces sp. JL4002]|uniref:hypothetical protein n=1 Tax=Streptomyces TaxID=1883 RepID=UPI0034098C75